MPRFDNNRVALIHGNDGTDVRVGKMCRSLSKMGFDTHFIGWDRRPRLKKTVDLGGAQPHVMVRETPFGKPTPGGTIRFARHIAGTLSKLRSHTVCCVNEDNIILALPWKHIFYRRLVCDMHDELMNRKSHCGRLVGLALRLAGNLGRAGAHRIMVVDQTRFNGFGRYQKKCTIVENYPEDPGPDLARRLPQGPTKIYVCGGLQSRRGVKQIVEAIDGLDYVQIVSAGWLYDDFARIEFANHQKVSFQGIVTASKSLELAAGCDAIFAFYEPTSINNLQASPNKIYDAMGVGRPVIINEEALVSQWVVDNKVGLRCSYYDVEALKEIITSLEKRRNSLSEYVEKTRSAFVRNYTWDSLEPKLKNVFTFR